MRRIFVFAGVVLAATGLAPSGFAQQPIREYTPIGSFTSMRACGYLILVTPLQDNLHTLTFSDGTQITTGIVKVRLTNVATGKSVDINISGPGFIDPDGGLAAVGPWLVAFLPGDLGRGSPRQLALSRGRVVVDAEGNVVSIAGTVMNLCEVLGP